MKCQKCQKFSATVHQLDVKYGNDGSPAFETTKFCSSCAQKEGLNVPNSENFPQVISILSKTLLQTSKNAKSGNKLKADNSSALVMCDQCGWTLDDFRQTSRLGCPNDYLVFSEYLNEAFESLHGHTKHIDWREDNEIETLNRKLKAAQDIEDYEACAEIRDRIQFLKKEISKELSPKGSTADKKNKYKDTDHV